jgi:hypothetical protein
MVATARRRMAMTMSNPASAISPSISICRTIAGRQASAWAVVSEGVDCFAITEQIMNAEGVICQCVIAGKSEADILNFGSG